MSIGLLRFSSYCCYVHLYNSWRLKQGIHLFNGSLSGTTWVSWYQKSKTTLDLLEQETVSGNGISLAICKSAPRPTQITTPAPYHSVFTDWMPFLPPRFVTNVYTCAYCTSYSIHATYTNKWLHHFVRAILYIITFPVYPLLTTSTLYWIITNASTTDTTWPSYSPLRYTSYKIIISISY